MLIKIILQCFLVCFVNVVYCQLGWEDNQTHVFQMAASKNFPIVAFFTSSKECPWSQKLQEEVMQSPLFHQKMSLDAILWQAPIDNHILLQKYHIHHSPQILLLDPQGREFARLEYLPLDAENYAAYIRSLIADFNEICLALDLNESPFREEKWQFLFQKTKRLSVPYFKEVILDRGVQEEIGSFFHLEKFASLLEKYKLKHPLVLKLKKQLLHKDPKNLQGIHSKVAVLEFEKLAACMKPNQSTKKVIAPLLNYVKEFRRGDSDCFKIELLIADFLFTKNERESAVVHAEAALAMAPESDRLKIAEEIASRSAWD